MTTADDLYMRRALHLASFGAGFVSPNPMVGAVIVSPDGKIIGQGWHRKFGGPHAEVNAVKSVPESKRALLPQSTIYVTLEPCSHYGKTPPCSELLIREKIKRVVIGSSDPFPLVSGRGVKMLREAGIKVSEGCLRKECDELNKRFITAHTRQRPYILLKWAQTADGRLAGFNHEGNPAPLKISTPLSASLMHRERAQTDAILVGTDTVIIDNPSLTTRLWPGKSPRPVLFSSPRLPSDARIMNRDLILLDRNISLACEMHRLYKDYGIISLMVEGGPSLLRSFLMSGLADELRIETSSDSDTFIDGNRIQSVKLP